MPCSRHGESSFYHRIGRLLRNDNIAIALIGRRNAVSDVHGYLFAETCRSMLR